MTSNPTPTDPDAPSAPPKTLLAIDLGVRTGLALYGDDGRLLRYRSNNLGSAARLKRAIPGIIADYDGLAWIIAEGDRKLGERWERAGARCGAEALLISAETWRPRLLHARQRRSGADAKQHADRLARDVIAWSGAPAPKGALRHDAAEAILIGLWGVLEVGWLAELPSALR